MTALLAAAGWSSPLPLFFSFSIGAIIYLERKKREEKELEVVGR